MSHPKKDEKVRLSAMRRTDKERLMAERVITSRTRNAVLNIDQEDHLSATELEEKKRTSCPKQ